MITLDAVRVLSNLEREEERAQEKYERATRPDDQNYALGRLNGIKQAIRIVKEGR